MTQTWVSSFHKAGSTSSPLAFTTTSPLFAAVQNALYNNTIAATGGVSPYAWLLVGQIGSNTWNVNPTTGAITGTPTVVETDTLTIKVTDSTGTNVTSVFSLPVQAQPTAAAPTFAPPAGSYGATQFVVISCATAGSTCYYTTDGSTPTFPVTGTTQQYTQGAGGIIVNASATIKAVGTASGFANSGVSSAAYVIGLPQAATPTFSPAAGTYSSVQNVTISCATSGSTIYYTTDGSTPTFPTTGTTAQYTSPVTVSASETIKAIGTASGFSNSVVGSAAYTISTGSGQFNFYIAPNGDDSNAGTLSSPWSLTALNTKQSTYRSQKIGIIGDIAGVQTPLQYGQVSGVQSTLYALLNAVPANVNTPILNVDGGTSASPTYLGSCTSAGVYQLGWAIIDCAQPGTGTHPTGGSGAQLMGQCGDSGTQVPHPDNVTFDGLAIRNFCFSAITGQSASTIMTNCVYKNLELYGCNTAATGNNPGALRIDRNSAQVLNCKFHDCSCSSGTFAPSYPGIMSYTSTGLVVTNCTFYNIGASVQQKDANQDATISYCYLDFGSFGNASGNTYGSYYEGVTGTGRTTTIHHCIFLGPMYLQGGSPANFSGNYEFYNNTIYVASLSDPVFYWQQPNAGGTFNTYNNVFYKQNGSWGSSGTYGMAKVTGANATTIPQWDYNYYLTAPQFCPSGNEGTVISYASWQALGFDAHSHVGGSPFAGTPSALNMASFDLSTSSSAYTGGVGGAICGALDGSGSIGCNF